MNHQIQEQLKDNEDDFLQMPYDSLKEKRELSGFQSCLEKRHHLNKVENWVNGTHSHGVVQCGVCGHKCRYDYTFPVHPNHNVEKVYKVKHNGPWMQVHYDELVFEFEDDHNDDLPHLSRREPTAFERLKSLFTFK